MTDPMLDGIQRYGTVRVTVFDWEIGRCDDGPYVLFSDLPALIARVREDERDAMYSLANIVYEQGRAEALREAREAVAALPWEVAISFGPIDCDYSCEDGACACSGVMRPEGWTTGPGDVLAALDALLTQTSPPPVEANLPSGAEVPASVAPAGEDHGALNACVCWLCRDLSLACEACENCVTQAQVPSPDCPWAVVADPGGRYPCSATGEHTAHVFKYTFKPTIEHYTLQISDGNET